MVDPDGHAAYTTIFRNADKLGNPERQEVLRIDLVTGAVQVVALLTGTGGDFVPLAYVA